MSEVRISAEPRSEFGKGAARRIRRDHRVPAVLYGHGGDPRHISLPGHELMLALKTPNVLLNITVDGKSELALPKDVQRDPVRGFLEHVDLLVVRRGEKVKVDVALHVVGTQVPDSVVMTEVNFLEVLAEATHIPTAFEIDISGRPVGSQIHAKEVELPAGVELLTDPEQLVVNISHSRAQEAEAEPAAAPGAGDAQPAAE
ncbi:MAG TPA: 50S ribosomal protein L25/general stress protein Ctc [Sporichthyaceae bacterium]|nr:50S ribosomal protein L25/general stress protein Ctc [Sporichthyaceae bacterium]